MSVLVVVESHFGNTLAVAHAVAEGLRAAPGAPQVRVLRTADAPMQLPEDVDLLLVGAPTHEFSLPTAKTRDEAVREGATDVSGLGLREWIAGVDVRPDLRVVTFETGVRTTLSFGGAAKAAAKALARRGFRNVERGRTFHVSGTTGPLVAEAGERSREWGAGLVG